MVGLAPVPSPNTANHPSKTKPRLHVRYLGAHHHAVRVELWTTGGRLDGLVVALTERGQVIARLRIARLGSHARELVLHDHGRGHYRLVVSENGRTLAVRPLRIG